MADRINGSVCLNHPNTPAVARCATCSKPICAECVQEFNGVKYCSKLCYDNAKRTGLMTEDVERRKAAANRKRKLNQFIYFLIIVLIIGGAAGYYFTHKKEVNKMVKNAQNKTEQSIKEGKKNVNKAVFKDSKYKRERENMVK